MLKLLLLVAVVAAAPAKLDFKTSDGSVCSITKTGKAQLTSSCGLTDPFHIAMTENVKGHASRIDQLETRVTKIESKEGVDSKALEAVAAQFCPDHMTAQQLYHPKGARTHARGFCKFNCKTGFHDSDNDRSCVACSKVTCSSGYYRHSDKCTTTAHHSGVCSKIVNYCPASASYSHASVAISGRKVGDSATIKCNSNGKKHTGSMKLTCNTAASWVVSGTATDCNVASLTYVGWTSWRQYMQPYSTQNTDMDRACSNGFGSGTRAMTYNEHLGNPAGMPSRNPTGRWLTFTGGMETRGGWRDVMNCHTGSLHCLSCYNPGSNNLHSGHSGNSYKCHGKTKKCTDIAYCWSNTRGVLCVKGGRRRLLDAPTQEEAAIVDTAVNME
jgi:hypothetical protein